jgi:hypothetical protein
MSFDGTVSVLGLLQIALLLAAIVAAFYTLRGQVRLLEEKIRNEGAQRTAYTVSQREQLHSLVARVDRLESQIETEIEKMRHSIDTGLARIYDKLDRKADK